MSETAAQHPTDQLFPELPIEIVLLILDYVVQIRPGKVVEWATLSRDFRPFIERLLYHSILLTSIDQVTSFVDLVKSGSRSVSFYQDRIRNLSVAIEISAKAAYEILVVCKDLHNMAFYHITATRVGAKDGADMIALRNLLATGTLQPIRLAIQPCYLPASPSVYLAILQHVTHLELSSASPTSGIYAAPDLKLNDTVLRHLPLLTHFSYALLCTIGEGASFAATLHLNDAIKVCIIWLDGPPGGNVPESLHSQDPRIVIGHAVVAIDDVIPEYLVLCREVTEPTIFAVDWGNRKSKEPDAWELAEGIVEQQRNSRQSDL
ncbi:hypothetical protein C8J56DRAFT_1126620 [Mycena floridula]|nr:hypothetical protein C8J56DRAFT_1126620 [Mycena floridula]